MKSSTKPPKSRISCQMIFIVTLILAGFGFIVLGGTLYLILKEHKRDVRDVELKIESLLEDWQKCNDQRMGDLLQDVEACYTHKIEEHWTAIRKRIAGFKGDPPTSVKEFGKLYARKKEDAER